MCEHCGSRAAKRPRARFCSKNCARSAYWAAQPVRVLTCQRCRKIFTTPSPQTTAYCADCKRAANQARHLASHPRAAYEYNLRHTLKKRGVGAEWFRDMLVGQAGRCAICLRILGPGQGTNIDHDHTTGRPRALLCRSCNLMIGNAGDSIRVLTTAIRYLNVPVP